MRRWLVLLLCAAGITVGVGYVREAPRTELSPPEIHRVRRAPGTPALLGSMASMVGLVPDDKYLNDWALRIDAGQPIAEFIAEILKSDRFSREIVPALLFGAFVNIRNYYALPSGFVLHRTPEAAVYYLRAPCAPHEAVKVRPWWNLASEVAVCPDAYRPAKWTMQPSEHSYRSRMVLTCDGQVGSPELETSSLCGCGPNLIRCMRDEEQYEQFNRSLMNEVKLTTAYIVEQDRPIAELFTGNSTFRDRNAELYYRRQKIGALEIARVEPVLADLATWPDAGRWAPREELRSGQHAGVLTAPQILHWLPDRRQRQRGYYEIMWCTMRNSFGATTSKVLELNATANIAFVHDSWERLAHTDLCTNCHARLDYGFQFFMGYPDSRASTHFNPALQSTGTGPLYGRDIQDQRGTAPLTPLGFANLATEQPDFTSCIANHFVDYVLGDRATAEDRRAIESAVEQRQRFKETMQVALERYAERWREESREVVMPSPAVGLDPPGSATVTIAPALRAKLTTHCTDCHDEVPYTEALDSGDRPYDFRPAQLPRPLVVRMVDHVSFGTMPKDAPLDNAPREELVRLLIDALWTDPAARGEAERFHLGKSRGLPAPQVDHALFAIDQLAHAPSGIAWGALERGIWSDQTTITPGFLAMTGLAALRACRAQNEVGAKLEQCLLDASSFRTLSRWPIGP